jgi:hypothetical protein
MQTGNDLHTHTLMIPASALTSTTSMMFTTSSANAHTHMVTLNAGQLSTIAGGGMVTVTSTNDGGHTHMYQIRCS